MQHASKKEGSDRPGYPDFIVTHKQYPNFVMIVECKADGSESGLNQACTEAIGYAQSLIGKYTVIIVGAAGTTQEELKISTALASKDGIRLNGRDPNYNGGIILPVEEYEAIICNKRAEKLVAFELKDIKQDINEILYAAGNLNSDRRMLILSACLIALRDKSFRLSFGNYAEEFILEETLHAVDRSLKQYGIKDNKRQVMMANFDTLQQLDVLYGVVDTEYGEANPISYILNTLHRSSIHQILEESTLNVDIMGEFYNEFITHGNDLGNAKNGFVLTPRHICELFADLGELTESTKILDMCFGTGGFLVAGMQKEILAAKGDKKKIANIKNNNICGVEIDGDRFTYGCVNMILRGDGQSNMIRGDCFSESIRQEIRNKHCTVGFINPPYALKTNELKFVKNMLDYLEPGGRGIAIIPQSCCTNKNSDYAQTRQEILRDHTLEAVISMPDQLFYPKAGVVTCVMIFTAGKSHNSDRKSWFANLKDDGLVIDRRSGGRADINGKWQGIKKKLVDAFIDRDVIDGFSLKQSVTAADEWSYTAYAKTDFSGITEESFKKVIKEYALFLLSQTKI